MDGRDAATVAGDLEIEGVGVGLKPTGGEGRGVSGGQRLSRDGSRCGEDICKIKLRTMLCGSGTAKSRRERCASVVGGRL